MLLQLLYIINKIKPFINNLNWKKLGFPPIQEDYEMFEINIKSIYLNILCIPHNTLESDFYKKVSPAYKSKFNKTREKQVILLIITDGQKQHYVAVKNLSSLLKKKADHSAHYYCLNCFKPFRIKSKLKSHEC